MRKIPTLFLRDPDTHLIKPTLTPGCEWVTAGEGIPTRKVDGSSVMLRDAKAFKRRVVKPGATPPAGFEPVETDPATGKQIGWAPIDPRDRGDQHHLEAINRLPPNLRTPSHEGDTYELVGPKVQRNTENLDLHKLILHADPDLHLDAGAIDLKRGTTAAEAFTRLDRYLGTAPLEGIVWHHPDGRMAKIKRRDFGHQWPPPPTG